MLTTGLERRQKSLEKAADRRHKARENLYPSAPQPEDELELPISLQWSDYAGTYKHPTYPNLVIDASPREKYDLHITTGMSGGLHVQIHLIHVSGEFFLAEVCEFAYQEPTAVVKAEFYIDVSRRVARFGIPMDFKDMPDTMIWFERSE